jgi:uncharacterized protein YjbJ (UPF0337 family)
MNWEQIEGNWKQFRGNVQQQWGKLTDDQLDVIEGKRHFLAGKIQEVYGLTKEATEQQLSEWQSRQKDAEKDAEKVAEKAAEPAKVDPPK